MTFQRDHHKLIAFVLKALDASFLKQHRCYFGGGTAIVLKEGEYRESVDMDFLVSDVECYRELREVVKKENTLKDLFNSPLPEVIGFQSLKVDQYGIRSRLKILNQNLKFEIIHEGRIKFDAPKPKDEICGVTTLSVLDLVASKILANSDRWADEGVFSRDLLDLAMMTVSKKMFYTALEKAQKAYGKSSAQDLKKAIQKIKQNPDYLTRCCQVLAMSPSPVEVWQKIKRIERWVS